MRFPRVLPREITVTITSSVGVPAVESEETLTTFPCFGIRDLRRSPTRRMFRFQGDIEPHPTRMFERDHCVPFQLFGDDVLRGVPKRPNSVVAVTDCEFAVLDESDYTTVKDRGLSQMSLDDKCHFLK